MTPFKKKVEKIIMGKATHKTHLASCLYALSHLYKIGITARNRLYKKQIVKSYQLPCFVISIGNITVGGTGKTPMTIYMATLLDRLGYAVVVISRGYKGQFEKKGGIVSNGKTVLLKPEVAGEEPYLIAKKLPNVPVLVGQDRVSMGMQAIELFKPDIILLDDGFQHLRIMRDLDILLLDAKVPFGNNHILPRGVLREPIEALLRSDGIILTRANEHTQSQLPKQTYSVPKCNKIPIFRARHASYIYPAQMASKNSIENNRQISNETQQHIKDQKAIIFSGIAKNADFQAVVQGYGCQIVYMFEFIDHHQYSASDIEMIDKTAKEKKASIIITTEKDFVKVAPFLPQKDNWYIAGVNIDFKSDENKFLKFLKTKLRQPL